MGPAGIDCIELTVMLHPSLLRQGRALNLPPRSPRPPVDSDKLSTASTLRRLSSASSPEASAPWPASASESEAVGGMERELRRGEQGQQTALGGQGQRTALTGVHVILDLVDLYAADSRVQEDLGSTEGREGAGAEEEAGAGEARNSATMTGRGGWMDENEVYAVLERGGDAGRIWAETVPHLSALLGALNASLTVCVPGASRPLPSSRGARARMGGGASAREAVTEDQVGDKKGEDVGLGDAPTTARRVLVEGCSNLEGVVARAAAASPSVLLISHTPPFPQVSARASGGER